MPSAYKIWLDQQPEHVKRTYREKKKQWAIDNREAMLRGRARWRKKNREKIREYDRAYRAAKREPSR